MAEQGFTFTVSLADIPIRIRCRREENMRFLRDYRTERAPECTVAPEQRDLDAVRAALERADRQAGAGPPRYSEAFLENNAIHALLAECLAQRDVLLMHGSALCMDGQAVIFTAKSGTGKSTHARLWREAFGGRVWMINDDKPLLRFGEGAVTVYGTPWDGKHRLSRNASAPLRAIVELERAAVNRIAPMPGPDAFQMLMRRAYQSPCRETMEHIVGLEKRLLDAADFYALGCNMEPEAALTAREGIGFPGP